MAGGIFRGVGKAMGSIADDIGESLKQQVLATYSGNAVVAEAEEKPREVSDMATQTITTDPAQGNGINQMPLYDGTPNIQRDTASPARNTEQRFYQANTPESREQILQDSMNPQSNQLKPVTGFNIPHGAVDLLRSNRSPEVIQMFDNKYGIGASANILGN